LYQIFIKHFCPFFKRPEQSATPKDIPPCGGKTFALSAYAKASADRWVRVALMNIWVVIKNYMLYNVGKCWIAYYTKNKGNIMLLKGYLTVEQVAKQLGLSEYRIRELIREKKIRAVKIGQWRIKPSELEKFIKSRSNL